MTNTFGKNLSALRKAARLTQKEVAEKLGVNVHTFIGYETAGREPKYDLLIKIADFFGVLVDDLIREKSTEKTGNDEAKRALIESVLALPPERLQLLAMLTQTAGEVGARPTEGGGTQYNLTFTVTPKNNSEQSKGEESVND